MILDESLEFCAATSAAASAGTALVGDVIDLSAAAKQPFVGQTIYLVITVTTAFASAGAATVTFKLATDATSTVANDGSATDIAVSRTYAYTALTAGTRIVIPVPWTPNVERYAGLLVVTAAATTSAGAITAGLMMDAPPSWQAYPDAVN